MPNFSEGARPDIYRRPAEALGAHGCLVLDVDPDPEHNRTVVSAVSATHAGLVGGALAAVAAAVVSIDLRAHAGLHPRLGAADVVPVVPLGGASMAEAVEVAWELGSRIWSELGVPVYWYGAAARRPEARRLSAIRSGALVPDLGDQLHRSAGTVCVGARPPLVAYNLVLSGVGEAEARGLAARLRESGGGLAGVQALVFVLPGGQVQLSMNLVDLTVVTPARIRAELAKLGVAVASEQVVGLCPAAAARDSMAAAGRVLEGRLAGATAVAAASAAESLGDEEHRLLAARLLRSGRELADLRPGGPELLAGAEQAAALSRVLDAGGLLTAERGAMLAVAASGLRAAVGAGVELRFEERVRLLDRWLAGG